MLLLVFFPCIDLDVSYSCTLFFDGSLKVLFFMYAVRLVLPGYGQWERRRKETSWILLGRCEGGLFS